MDEPQPLGCRLSDIDDHALPAVPAKRPTIDDSHEHLPAVLEVRHPHDGPKWQRGMRGNELILVEDLPTGGPLAVQSGTVVGCESDLGALRA